MRLALVLNGGVSLAVWMAGVVRELEIARRASRGERRPSEDGPECRHYDFWRRATAKAEIDVDIVAGTSAGGLNGTLLAAALATGTPLQDLKPMWAKSAALSEEALLRRPAPTSVPSLLDGGYFQEKAGAEIDCATRNDGGSGGRPVTLFVTATALGRADRHFQDSAGTSFSASDHRCVYRFRNATTVSYDSAGGIYRSQERNDFIDHADDLKVAARASAGFPVAFEPVEETAQLSEDPELSIRRPRGRIPRWLVDGGVLDNAPFEAVLDEILLRPLENVPVRRVVAYIAPSNGRAHSGPDTSTSQPNWTTVLRAAQGFPSESDFRGDVDNIDRTLLAAATANSGPEFIFRRLLGDPDGDFPARFRQTAVDLYPVYRAARITTACVTVRQRIASELDDAPCELGAPPEGESEPAGDWLAKDLPESPSNLGLDATERAVRLLMKITRSSGSLVAAERLSVITRRLSALRDEQSRIVVRRALESEAPLDELLSGSRVALDRLIGATYTTMSLSAVLEVEVQQAVDVYVEAVGASSDRVRSGLVAAEVVPQALAPALDAIAPPDFDFLRIGPDHESPLVAGLTEEVTATGRTLSALGEDKLYGTRLNHFGAFGRSDWRNHDWVWGRLDAAAHLARNLRLDEALVVEAQELALKSEGVSTDRLLDGLRELGAMTDTRLVDRLRETPSGRRSLELAFDSALRLLGDSSDQAPRLLQKYGPRVQAALQLHNPPSWPAGMSLPLRGVLGLIGRYTKSTVLQWIHALDRDPTG